MDAQPIDRACEIAGSQAALAELLGIRSPSISEWRARGRVPITRCAEIERATDGAVTRHDLRPDIFGPAPASAAPAIAPTSPGRAAVAGDAQGVA